MWKRQEEPTTNVSPLPVSNPPRTAANTTSSSIAHIGKSVQIKGELTGSEDFQIDGKVEGTIELRGHALTIGEGGNVRANVNARKVIILGSIEGNIHAAETVDIRRSGSLVGDLVVAGVSIEEGAYFRGTIDIQRAGEEGAGKRNETRRLA